ncbi:hypothetical protein AO376_0856 [Moraxella catarrhalis]|nr:hypothetical protein AO376_0856 [Moraxella catarrhalis]OAV17443.1 hypothetical protein AO374_1230 [Moraxella catarrhalis]
MMTGIHQLPNLMTNHHSPNFYQDNALLWSNTFDIVLDIKCI